MKNKYFILAITFLCLLMGQSSFGQKSGDYDDVNNDDDPTNDMELRSYIDPDLVGTIRNVVYDPETGITTYEIYEHSEGWFPVDTTSTTTNNTSSGGGFISWGGGSAGLSTGGSGGDDNNDSNNNLANSDNSGSSDGTSYGASSINLISAGAGFYPGDGDAIFSLSGDYLTTGTSSTRFIYIERYPGYWYTFNSFKLNTDNIVPYFGPDRNEENRKLVDKIITYYAKKIGITADIVIDSTPYTNPNALAYSTIDEIHIAIHDDGKIDPLLSNFNNLMSVLYHEKLHLQDKKDGKPVTYRSHAEVYMKQILEGPDFSKTTYEFQKGQFLSFVTYLYNAQINNQDVDDLIKNFNLKSNNWKIGTNGYRSGYGYPYSYKGNIDHYVPEVLSTPN